MLANNQGVLGHIGLGNLGVTVIVDLGVSPHFDFPSIKLSGAVGLQKGAVFLERAEASPQKEPLRRGGGPFVSLTQIQHFNSDKLVFALRMQRARRGSFAFKN